MNELNGRKVRIVDSVHAGVRKEEESMTQERTPTPHPSLSHIQQFPYLQVATRQFLGQQGRPQHQRRFSRQAPQHLQPALRPHLPGI